jgi:hypothetical protein
VLRALSSKLRFVARTYLTIALVYGAWVLVLLQFGECGLFGTACKLTADTTGSAILSAVLWVVPPIAVYSLPIAFFRGILWLPNLLIAIVQSSFFDWLFVRDVPPMNDFILALAGILP